MPPPEVIDHVGQRFGFLTVLRREGSTKKYAAWRCACDCGQEAVTTGYKLRKGLKKACNIAGHCWRSTRGTKTGLTTLHPSAYGSWEKMWERCVDRKSHRFKRYGGRGIKVCARWKEFKNFYADMGPKPTSKHTIGRIDNDGPYELGNCKWETREEQARNTSRSVRVVWQGETILLLDLATKFGIQLGVVYGRIKNGWPLEDALTTPVHPRVQVEFEGKQVRLRDVFEKTKIHPTAVRSRLNIGWTLAEALSIPLHQHRKKARKKR